MGVFPDQWSCCSLAGGDGASVLVPAGPDPVLPAAGSATVATTAAADAGRGRHHAGAAGHHAGKRSGQCRIFIVVVVVAFLS